MAFPNFMTAWRSSQRIDQRGGDLYGGPKSFRTPFSSTVNGMTTIDPSIRASQNEALETYLGQNRETRSRFLGNQSAFRQARINPLERRFSEGRAQMQQGQGLRRIAGSSFADQALQGYDADAARAIGEEGAKAEMEDLQALAGLDEASLNAVMQTRAQQYAQELQALGLSQQQIAMEMQSFEEQQRRRLTQAIAQAQSYNQTLGTVHKLVTDWGDFSTMTGSKTTANAGCYIAAFHFGTWTYEHFVIARHVHTAKTFKAKLARIIYKALYPLFKSLLKEANNGRA